MIDRLGLVATPDVVIPAFDFSQVVAGPRVEVAVTHLDRGVEGLGAGWESGQRSVAGVLHQHAVASLDGAPAEVYAATRAA